MKFPVSVYLFGGEGTGWALDADVATTKQSLLAIPDLVTLTSLEEADVVHSVWDYPLLNMSILSLDGKRIVCHVCNDLMRTYEDPCMTAAGETLGLWIAISKIAEEEIKRLNHKVAYIPYSVDRTIFTESLPQDSSDSLRKRYNLPGNRFVISNFMRDSSMNDLSKPKEQKGVEFFVAVVDVLHKKRLPLHILLAGPRRHWLRKQLSDRGIPYTFIGDEIEEDDIKSNILSPEQINELYHASDLHLVTSRWEGGPRAVLECAATMTPIFCTPVGMAPDILEAQCLISSIDDAVEKTESLIELGPDSYPSQIHYDRVLSTHTPEANVERFRRVYENINSIPVFDKTKIHWQRKNQPCVPMKRSIITRVSDRLTSLKRNKRSSQITIGLWHEYHKPPYGGGNQFMMALKKYLEQRGVDIVVNKFKPYVDVYICNSAWFDKKKFKKKSQEQSIRMIHRIDGPVTLYRGEGPEEDDKIFNLNNQFASATVFQSAYSFMESCALGYSPVSPVVIHNAVDAKIFNSVNRSTPILSDQRKIRLISTAWSDNPNKGGPFYKWLDDHLDFERFDYTFVGRVKQEFKNIRHLPPQDSENLADILREHDIYVSASFHEPCSNALLEALACGLPALYRNDGGNSELVGFAGLAFNGENDFLDKLNRLVSYYDSFCSAISIKSMEEIAGKYYELALKVVDSSKNL